MGTKITFTKLVTPLESIQVDFGDGEGLKDYNTNEARTNGIEIPPTVEDFADITIKGQDVQVNELKFLVDGNSGDIDNRAKDILVGEGNTNSFYCKEFRTLIYKDTLTDVNIDSANIKNLRLPRSLSTITIDASIGNLFIPDDIDPATIKNGDWSTTGIERVICSDVYPLVEFYNNTGTIVKTIIAFPSNSIGNNEDTYECYRMHLTKAVNILPTLSDYYYSLNEITVDDKNITFKSDDDVLYSKDGTILFIYPPNKSAEEYEIPVGTTTIKNNAFNSIDSLNRIIIPSTIQTIEDYAFNSFSPNITYNGTLANFNTITFGNGSYVKLIKKKMLAQALNRATLSLIEFSTLLDDNDVYTDPENPISPTLTPASADGIWTHDELQSLADLIKTKKVYIDLRNTDLKHEYDEEITEELIAQEEDGGIWGDEDNSKYCTSEAGTESIRAFPGVFANNTYLVGINMPETDNYTVNTVFKDCTNLKHVGFSGTELWKIGKLTDESGAEDDDYYIWYGMDNFVHKLDSWITVLDTEEEAMDILRSGAGLMWYYDYWVDYQSNPGEITTRPASNEIELTGLRNVSSAVVMHLNEDVTVDETTIPATNPEEPPIEVASIDYNDDVTIENGIVQL